MIPLQSLVQAVQAAVVEAADQVRRKNISILQEYFVSIPPTDDLPGDPPLVPRVITIDFPQITEAGPVVHPVQVPLISIAPPANLYLAEFRVRMRVEFDLHSEQNDGRDALLRVAPTRIDRAAARSGAASANSDPLDAGDFAEIEILIKHGDEPIGLKDVVQGYGRALRAEIPG